MNLIKFFKQRWIGILFVASFAFVGLMMFTVGTVSLARYTTSQEVEEDAGVANIGIKTFELVPRGNEYWNGVEANNPEANGLKVDYNLFIPGFDIPGPHLRLNLESEVSYRVYLKVTQPKTFPTRIIDSETVKTVSFSIADEWKQTDSTENKDGTITYIYEYDYFFRAGETYNYTDTGEGEIEILEDDKIYVSEYYMADKSATASKPELKLTFEAFIRQAMA